MTATFISLYDQILLLNSLGTASPILADLTNRLKETETLGTVTGSRQKNSVSVCTVPGR